MQAFFSLLFFYDLLQSLVRFRTEPLSWETHEALELAGVLGLLPGFVWGSSLCGGCVRNSAT